MGNTLLSPRNAKVFSYHSPERTRLPSLLPDHQSIKILIERQDWKGLIQILWDNEDWVRSPECFVQGLHPIHRALMVQAPVPILETILQIDPTAMTIPDEKKSYPIHYAVQYGSSLEVLELVCQQDEIAMERLDAQGRLPLHVAVMHDNSSAFIQTLIQKAPNSLRVRTKLGALAIHVALENRAAFDVIKVLLEAHPESARQSYNTNLPLHCACENKTTWNVFTLLLDANPMAVNCYGVDGKLPLHGAIANKCSFEIIEKLTTLNEEALLHRDKTGRMPIHYALESKVSDEIILHLISKCPDCVGYRGRGTPGNFPLAIAIENHISSNIVLELIRIYPLAIKTKTVYGMYPLRSAIKEKMSLDVILTILDYFPEAAGESDEHGRVALHYAASRNSPMILVEGLVHSYPPGVSKFDRNNQLPIHLACIRVSDLAIVKLLLSRYPQSASILDKYYYSPMNYIIENHGAVEYLEVLAKAHDVCLRIQLPDPLTKKEGKLPLHHAIEFQRPFEIIDFLVQAYPESCQIRQTGSNKLAMHLAILRPLAIESLLSIEAAFPLAASYQDDIDHYPIHYAIIMKTDSRLIQRLIVAYPVITRINHLPLHAAPVVPVRPETNDSNELSYLEEDGKHCCRGNRLLLHYAIERHTSPENVAEILKCTMPYDINGDYNQEHFFSWTHVLAHTHDQYWRSVELLLESYSSDIITLLAEFPDEDTRKALDIATKRCHGIILYRLHYFARYEFVMDTFHRTDISMIKFGVDHFRNRREPIVLKFMSCSKSFQNEIRLRERIAFDSQYVLHLCSSHNGEEDYNYREEGVRKRLDHYPFLIVTLRGTRSLEQMIRHDNIAGKVEGIAQVKQIGRKILHTLKYLHDIRMVHGNLSRKSYNLIDTNKLCANCRCMYYLIASHIIDDNGKMKVVDLAFTRAMQFNENIEVDYGRRAMAYIAPEIAELYFQQYQQQQYPNIAKKTKTLPASASMDMWSFGAILYFLLTGEPVFLTSHDHNIDTDQLEMLMKWPLFAKVKRMKKIADVKARNLVEQLLSMEVRLRPDVSACLQHPFFAEDEEGEKNKKISVRYIGMPSNFDIYLSYRYVNSNTAGGDVDKNNRLQKIKKMKGINQHLVDDKIHCEDLKRNIEQTTTYSVISTDQCCANSSNAVHTVKDTEEASASKTFIKGSSLEDMSIQEERSETNPPSPITKHAISSAEDGVLDEIFCCLTQSKSMTIILSRFAVNCDEFSIANITKFSTSNHFLFELRLALELMSRGYLEGGIQIIAFGDLLPPENVQSSAERSPSESSLNLHIDEKEQWVYQPFFQHFQQEMTLAAGGSYPTKVSDICMQPLEDSVSRLLQKYGMGLLHHPLLSIKELFYRLLQMPTFHVLGPRNVAIAATCEDYFVSISSKLGKFRASSSHQQSNNAASSRPSTSAFQRMLDARIPSPEFNRKTPINWFRDREVKPQSPIHHYSLNDIIAPAQDGMANSNNSRGGMLSRGGLFSRQGLASSHGKASPMSSPTKKVTYDANSMNIGTVDEMEGFQEGEQVVEQDVVFFNNANSTFTSNFQLHQHGKPGGGGPQVPFFTELVAMDKANSEEMMHFMVEKMESRDNEVNTLVLELTLMEERMRLQQLEISRLRYLVQVTSRKDYDDDRGDEE